MSIREFEPNLAGTGLRVGVVQARFNENIGEGLRSGCLTELARLGVAGADVTYATVPGALELPLTLQAMAQSKRFDALAGSRFAPPRVCGKVGQPLGESVYR